MQSFFFHRFFFFFLNFGKIPISRLFLPSRKVKDNFIDAGEARMQDKLWKYSFGYNLDKAHQLSER